MMLLMREALIKGVWTPPSVNVVPQYRSRPPFLASRPMTEYSGTLDRSDTPLSCMRVRIFFPTCHAA